MKTILVLTDFSINADYVAQYALRFARDIKANILLCNIYQAPAEEVISDRVSWPMRPCAEDSNNDLSAQLAQLKSRMDSAALYNGFRPDIEQYSGEGTLSDTINELSKTRDILLAVISKHGADKINGYFIANNAWDIVDNAVFPVMVIPYQAKFKPFRMIAFATVMNYTDIDILESLSGLAKYSNAEILITNVTGEEKEENTVKRFFNQVPDKIKYPGIVYRNIIGSDVVKGLKQLCAQFNIDLLVMVHQKYSFFEKIFGGNITRKMTASPNKPLLIFPSSTVKATLTVF